MQLKQKRRDLLFLKVSSYLVAGAIKVYSWKNETHTNIDFREVLENFLKQNKRFSVRSMEKCLGYYSANPMIARKQANPNIHGKDAEKTKKLAYYYISKLLKKSVIKKTNKYEKQSNNEKPLMIYEIVK